MKKILLFGASKACEYYLQNNHMLNVIAILDNDIKKQGNVFLGYPVLSPENGVKLEYDSILITSMYVKKITSQLVNELNVSRAKIEYPPKRLLKQINNPFQHPTTLKVAEKLFFTLISEFEKHNIVYFVEYGTLLGIVRDNKFIEWDDDIDFSIHPDSVVELLKQWTKIIGVINKELGFDVKYEYYHSNDNEVIEIDLIVSGEVIREFSVNIGLIKFKGNFAFQKMNAINKKYYLNYDKIIFKNKKLNSPSPVEEYLEATYGEWKVVKKDTTFNDNTLTFFD